jgi:hypothetical protein
VGPRGWVEAFFGFLLFPFQLIIVSHRRSFAAAAVAAAVFNTKIDNDEGGRQLLLRS